MKLAFYSDSGTTQVVITPETDWEKSVLAKIPEDGNFNMYRGSFYECRGGWIRQQSGYSGSFTGDYEAKDDASLIFKFVPSNIEGK